MKNICKIGLIGLVFALINCQSVKSSNMFYEGVQPEKVSDQFSFTEGPSTDELGNVYFTDQPNDKIYYWDWKSNQVIEFLNKTGRANGTHFDKDGFLITCSDDQGEMWKISKDKKIEILFRNFEGKRFNGPNDVWNDASGGMYFTDPLYIRDYWVDFKQELPHKSIYYRDNKGNITRLETFTQPNGIVGSERLKKLYISDIDAGKTYVYDILGDGKLSDKKLFCEMGSDGMTLDKHGNLYLTGDGVHIFNRKGKKIYHISIPEKWTSNVTFGGKNNDVLFITASQSVYTFPMRVRGIQ
ncbi:SMP-30/gluconolactonase/LRE family protein [Chryseobacterium phosphatilyticum]|uniref:SMP-30/gluconolactonase/LRE family protein n=1 Tax=Chryseobacterium phosphatilyticum TaxID=475075 RepID=A0A316X5P1_9FLAO|nr:SMP-30/gluconolactonase/LRE family protein [Chryseobacterium phosphatilyticum]PWN69135.1 SMP-30/gluconolactonase/LRE family protein [Chryseobacterium phosphatilyticum]